MRSFSLLIAGILAMIMAVVAGLMYTPPGIPMPATGICFPAVAQWPLLPLWSWGINMGLILLSTVGAVLIDKEIHFLRGAELTMPATMLILCGSDIAVSPRLTSGALTLAATVICLALLFNCKKGRNATQPLFLIASILSFGASVDYAFVAILGAMIAGAFILGVVTFKELLAILMGIAAPWWILFGMGIVNPAEIHIPQLVYFDFSTTHSASLLFILISIGLSMLLSLIFALNNSVSLLAGNSHIRGCNNVINLLGFVCAVFCVIDFSNIQAYLVPFYLTLAVQTANFFGMRTMPRKQLVIAGMYLIYIIFFILSLHLYG